MKMRETDRLIRNIALCVHKEGLSLKAVEKEIRETAMLSAKVHNTTVLDAARMMWGNLKGYNARKKMNQWTKDGYFDKMSIKDFDWHKDILERFQRNTRHLEELKNKKKER